jgi:hypothetical protein
VTTISKSQIDQLGDRLRKGAVSEEDLGRSHRLVGGRTAAAT